MSAPASPVPAAPIRVAAGTTAGQAVRDAGLPARGVPDAVVVVRDVDGRLRDLSWVPEADVDVTPVAADTDDGRSVIRHSAAHVLAQAVQDAVPRRQARHRPAHHRRLLLRLRRRRAIHPGRSRRSSRSGCEDRQGRPAVLPSRLRVQGAGPRGTGRRAVQTRTHRRQVRRPRRHGGRRRRADRLRQPQSPHPRTGVG